MSQPLQVRALSAENTTGGLYHLSPFRRRGTKHLTVTIYVHISVHNGYMWNTQYISDLLTYIMHGDIFFITVL